MSIVYVLSVGIGIAIALVGGAAALVIAAWLVNALVYAVVTAVSNVLELVAPSPPLPRATASFHHGDRP